MNENVIEIVSYLVKRIMHDDDIIENEEELVRNLIDQGYDIDDIDTAFDLIFATDVADDENKDEELKFAEANRILDLRERFKLSTSAQGVLIRLASLSLINDDELERVLKKTLQTREREIGLKNLWQVLQKVIDSPMRLSTIIENSPEFDSINDEHRQYIN
ncbi:MAG: DUF494 family protein [Bacillota bacterium]